MYKGRLLTLLLVLVSTQLHLKGANNHHAEPISGPFGKTCQLDGCSFRRTNSCNHEAQKKTKPQPEKLDRLEEEENTKKTYNLKYERKKLARQNRSRSSLTKLWFGSQHLFPTQHESFVAEKGDRETETIITGAWINPKAWTKHLKAYDACIKYLKSHDRYELARKKKENALTEEINARDKWNNKASNNTQENSENAHNALSIADKAVGSTAKKQNKARRIKRKAKRDCIESLSDLIINPWALKIMQELKKDLTTRECFNSYEATREEAF